jgi:hypothetical protein
LRDVIRGVFAVLLLAAVAAIVTPGVVLGMRLADTWTGHNTDQLLGGLLSICGGAVVIVALLVGAGLFAKMARHVPSLPSQRDIEPDPAWRVLPPATPAWPVTGGGQFELLPPAQQDRRFSIVPDPGSARDDH